MVNGREWLKSQRYGLFVQTITKTDTGIETGIKRFYNKMAPSFFEYKRRVKNRKQFISYFTSNEKIVKNETVIVFVTSGLCDNYSFGDWLDFLQSEQNTGLIFEQKYSGDWRTAVVTACKGKCPDGFNPSSIFGFNAALNVSIEFESKFPLL